MENGTLRQWRRRSDPIIIIKIYEHLLEVAKAIQYMHSLGIMLAYVIRGDNIFIDSNRCAKLFGEGLSLQYLSETPARLIGYRKDRLRREADVMMFGCLFYEIYFNVDIGTRCRWEFTSGTIPTSPPREGPEIQDHAWQLIQRCYAEDPDSRPTMDEVVEEMESWS
jgi:serine/threonine protein kinase